MNSRISAALAEERAPAFYAERAYTDQEAEDARCGARLVYSALSGFLR